MNKYEPVEAKIMEDSCYEAIDAVNELLEKYNLRVEFKEYAADYETIYIVDSNVGIG